MAMSDYEIEESYKEMLDDVFPVVKIGYSEFYASDILKNCDPVAYRIGLSEYFEEYLNENEEEE
jgi:hypothetical protein